MALAEAERLALAEGLTLVLEPSNLSGFKGVCETRNGTFAASARTGPRGTAEPRYLGTFGSAAEAALAVARHMGAEACEAAALQDHPDPRVRDQAWLAHVVGDVWGDFLVDTGDGGAGHDEPWSEAELPVEPVGGGTGFEDGPSGED